MKLVVSQTARTANLKVNTISAKQIDIPEDYNWRNLSNFGTDIS